MIVTLANGLAELGHSVTVFTPDYSKSSPFPIDDRVEVRILRTSGSGALRKLGYVARLCWRSAAQFDVVYATAFKTPWYIAASKWIRGSRAMLVYLLQGYDARTAAWNDRRNPLSRALFFVIARWGYWLPFDRVAVSSWVAEKVGGGGIRVIPNGISLSTFHPAEPRVGTNRRFRVGTIASSAPAKGYAVFLEAVRGLPDEVATRMQVAVASFENVTLPTNVESTLLHPVSDEDLASFYRTCDAFVFTSYMEGFGLPALEAMACGVPVVTTDCGGIREFVSEQNALVVPTGRADLVRDAILRLEADGELRERLRTQAIATAGRFPVSRMVQAHESLLTQWCSSVSDRTASHK